MSEEMNGQVYNRSIPPRTNLGMCPIKFDDGPCTSNPCDVFDRFLNLVGEVFPEFLGDEEQVCQNE